MASTNKTTNLSLSQFIATDKPSWLSDYNADMAKIDAGYGTAISDSASAVSGAASASAAAQAAQTTANSAETRSTSNAASIRALNDLTTPQNLTITQISGNTSSFGGYASTCSGIISLRFSANSLSATTGAVTSEDRTFIPIFSIPGNIIKLPTSTLGGDNQFFVGYCNIINSSNITRGGLFNAYYDGTNTIFYLNIKTASVGSITDLWGSFAVIPTGSSASITQFEFLT